VTSETSGVRAEEARRRGGGYDGWQRSSRGWYARGREEGSDGLREEEERLRWAAAASRGRDRETLPDHVTAGTETPCCPVDGPRMRPGARSPNKKNFSIGRI
jgi:hypothetical protein